MKAAIFAYAFDLDRVQFFERFRDALAACGLELVLISNRPALARQYPLLRCLSRPVRAFALGDDLLIKDSLEYRVGNRDIRSARRLVCALDDCLDGLRREYSCQAVFIWNGSALPERVMTRFARQQDIGTVYFENSNFPGRMIIDGEGVNAQCSIARNPSALRNYPSPLTSDEFEQWKQGYIVSQRQSHKVHQAKGVRQINWSFLYDAFMQVVNGVPKYEMYPLLTKAVRKLDALLYRPQNHVLESLPERFVFLPLQVQSDSQLIFNSEIGNEEAIAHIAGSLEPGQVLVVKQHPAEPNKRAQRRYSEVIAKFDALEISNNTFELMLAAEKVYTINSTAGLQAKLMGKPVECLGRAVFAGMNDEELNCYIHGFLSHVEFFDSVSDLAERDVNSVLSRKITLKN
ncbi:capsular polysaccharide export protein, LipB/KpsS family [Zhongshania aliphaticivorans]|uniref:capsular polysaccharide export protein, LipB/KpsS family n=1 Tax=Zhongshania aliphaticivorans TaxID=1470434 RepID=UPI0012E4A99D|nr:hypothetical protein [Zhongshania aliphaticivorans]CAA0118129.1 Uncharacterised protein [Zhongshania aliphaticivorans]